MSKIRNKQVKIFQKYFFFYVIVKVARGQPQTYRFKKKEVGFFFFIVYDIFLIELNLDGCGLIEIRTVTGSDQGRY